VIKYRYERKITMNKKIVIASDSTSDLSTELIEKYDVKTLPLTVNLGGNIYSDGVDVNPDMIYAHYEKTGELPKTAAPNIADFEDFFSKYTADGSEMIFFTISSEMSSTYSNARLAASEFTGVYVVDTRNLSTGGGLLVVSAAEMAKEGMAASEIAAKCEEMTSRVDASFVIDNLEFLHKGGRCSAVAAFGANMLQLKPCITVSGGKMGVEKKYRGRFAKVLETYVADRIGDASDIELDHVFVTHAGCDAEIVQQCVDQVKALQMFDEVLVTRAGCTVSSHCGRNTLGVLFVKE
jgi:DegV family protein with EDD domain